MRSLFAFLVLWSAISANAAQWYQDGALAESRPDIGLNRHQFSRHFPAVLGDAAHTLPATAAH